MLGVHSDGGMADWLCVPDDNLVDASGVGLDETAMAEFLAIGAHAVRRGEIAAGQKVLIVGAGPIGISCAAFAIFARRRCSTRDRIGWTSAARRSASITS